MVHLLIPKLQMYQVCMIFVDLLKKYKKCKQKVLSDITGGAK